MGMTDDHTSTVFDAELLELTQRVIEMGGLAEHMVEDAVSALTMDNPKEAQEIILRDQKLDLLQRAIEDQAILMIARRQPVADDLRRIVGTMRIVSDLERVGDLAKNIAKRVIAISGEPRSKSVTLGVEHIAELTLVQLKHVLDAFVSLDGDMATQVRSSDDQIDALYNSLFRELLTYMMEDPRTITFCTHLLFCAKNIERIGDHATNVAETVYYITTGDQLDEPRSKADYSAIEMFPQMTKR